MPPAFVAPSERWLIAGLLLVCGLIAGGGLSYHQAEGARQVHQAGAQLRAAGQLQVRQIAAWRQERLADGRLVAADGDLAAGVGRLLDSGAIDPALLDRLEALRAAKRYQDVLILDAAGQLRYSLDRRLAAIPPGLRERLPKATAEHPELHVDRLAADVIVPLLVGEAAPRQRIATLLLRNDPGELLVPLLHAWPMPTQSATGLLLQRAGEGLQPLTGPAPAAAPAIRLADFAGPGGIGELRDPRGTPILATLLAIPATDWYLLTRIERDEALAAWRATSRLIIGLTLGLLLAAVAAFGLIRQRRDLRRYRTLLATETARHTEQRRFRIAFEASPLAASIARADDGRFVDVNTNHERDFGWTRSEMIGRNALEIGLWPDAEARAHFLAELQVSGSIVCHEARWHDRHGGLRAVELSAALIDIDGVMHILCFATDVTERRKVQAELASYRRHLESRVEERTRELAQTRDDAEHASRAKSAFLANMSHEIRTPLNAVIGLTHMMRQDATEPRLQGRLDRVADSARHLLAVINDILDISKIEAERLTLNECNFSSTRIFAETLDMVALRAREKGLRLHAELAPDLPPYLHGDPLRLQQILLNFLSNAIKFTDQGQITLRAGVAERLADGIVLRCEVEDSGSGIAADVLARLFKPFEQADNSTTRRYSGTGLGLAICRQLARIMGGDAEVDSQPGHGSTFRVTVRLGVASAPDPDPQPAPPGPLLPATALRGAGRLLLVEDDPLNREVALDQLERLGLAADVAENGAQAVDLARATAYDLILMDMQMPVMDGLEATRCILALPGRQRTPIVAMTANAFAENRAACLAAGMVDHLSKPVDQAALRRSLARWLPAAPPAADHWPTVVDTGIGQVEPAAGNETAAGNGLLAALAGDTGFDSACGLAALGGSADKYALLLRKYLEVHDGTVAAIGTALAAADPVRAKRLAHTLKGTAATLGLPATSAAAADLERALADNAADEAAATVAERLHQLADVHRRQTDTLRLALAAAGAP